jgi:hypothetical protein
MAAYKQWHQSLLQRESSIASSALANATHELHHRASAIQLQVCIHAYSIRHACSTKVQSIAVYTRLQYVAIQSLISLLSCLMTARGRCCLMEALYLGKCCLCYDVHLCELAFLSRPQPWQRSQCTEYTCSETQ